MGAMFPSFGWLTDLKEKLNADERYNKIARNWEGDIVFSITPEGNLTEPKLYYIDLWHGKCRGVQELEDAAEKKATFVLTASYENFKRIMTGKLDPMQAMMTRRLLVQGNFAVLMRSVPTVLDFVRCAREITIETI